MKLRELSVAGTFEMQTEFHGDERGFFVRTIEFDMLRNNGLCDRFEQESISYNAGAGTLRGVHYQAAPMWETKIVTCIAGRAFDVVVDLRRNSPTFGRWAAVDLDASLCNSVYVPVGCAHAFQALVPGTSILYRITPKYDAALQRGIDPFDPDIGIVWPIKESIVSARDRALPKLRDFA